GELIRWTARLWEAEAPEEVLSAFWLAEPLRGAGLWFPAAVLHLREPHRFQPWDYASRQGFARLVEEAEAEDLVQRYRLFNEGSAWLCQRYRIHPLELPGLLAAVAEADSPSAGASTGPSQAASPFAGFSPDTFQFLGELEANNRRDWMEG